MPADPKDLAARPAFAGLLARLRGGEGPCPTCEGRGFRLALAPGGLRVNCNPCSGSGRVAVPPDPGLAPMAADWWQQEGGGLAGLLWVYAFPPEWWAPTGYGATRLPPLYDDSPRPVLAAWDEYACPARAQAVRGMHVGCERGAWFVFRDGQPWWHGVNAERHARLGLKRAVLRCFDPGNPFDGGAGVLIPMRAEGARLTARLRGAGQSFDTVLCGAGVVMYPALFDSPFVPGDPADEYRLDGVRVGAPPGWSWTPHALPGDRLAVTWQCAPSSLLPAADAGGRTSRRARHVQIDLEGLRR
jgi:hypothetical protein